MKVHKGNRNGGYWQPPELPELKLPQAPRHRSKKDTKRWCLGRPGKEHTPQWFPKFYAFDQDKPAYFEWKCAKCKKVLKTKWNDERKSKL